MPRQWETDGDEARNHNGMTRVGYDADTQTYTYRDSNGKYFEGPPGATYGTLRPVGNATASTSGPPPPYTPREKETKPEGPPATTFDEILALMPEQKKDGADTAK